MIHVSIADAHPLMREGIKKVLHNQYDFRVSGEAKDGSEVLTMLAKELPEILILEISLPGKSGLELLKEIQVQYPKLSVLMLSVHPAERFAIRALKAGAKGYLCKTCVSDHLIYAIRKIVNEKRIYLSPDVAEQLALQFDNSNRPLHESLTDREFEVFCLIAAGYSAKYIARQLSLCLNTIHTYRSRIKDKMNIKTNIEMAHYAIENRLISLALSQ